MTRIEELVEGLERVLGECYEPVTTLEGPGALCRKCRHVILGNRPWEGHEPDCVVGQAERFLRGGAE